ncbi:MAG TPA: DUF4426 domain-containing protein, partial [Luteimonas sp.]|nr:DUF4426 domain-containing protein [Luteimonas sp.]
VGASTSNASTSTDGAQSDAIARVGDVSVRASVIQTSMLNEAIARQYDIARDPKTVLLLVAVRQGPDASASALPATITATATDLRGGKQDIAMRELKTGDLIDYVGTVTTTLPDTLRFDLTVVRAGGAISTLQLQREFYPQ